MEGKTKKRFGVLDVVILLTVIAAIAAFISRGRIRDLLAEDGTAVVTYAFSVSDVEPATAASLQAGGALYTTNGAPVGTVLTVTGSDATDEQRLLDGRVVSVVNGKLDLTGSVTAKGYTANGFVYLGGGILLVPGGSLTVSTGDAIFVLRITHVQFGAENSSN